MTLTAMRQDSGPSNGRNVRETRPGRMLRTGDNALRGRHAAAVAVDVSGLRRLCGLRGRGRAGGARPTVLSHSTTRAMFAPNRTLSGSACRAAIVSGRLAFALNLDGSGDEQASRIDRGDELYKALRISMMIGNEAPTTSSEQIDASIGSGRWHHPRPLDPPPVGGANQRQPRRSS